MLSSMNCGETDPWIRLMYFLWARELKPYDAGDNSYSIGNERVMFWGNGDMKWLDHMYVGGGSNCDMPLARFQFFLSMLNCSWKMFIEDGNGTSEVSRKVQGSTYLVVKYLYFEASSSFSLIITKLFEQSGTQPLNRLTKKLI